MKNLTEQIKSLVEKMIRSSRDVREDLAAECEILLEQLEQEYYRSREYEEPIAVRYSNRMAEYEREM